MSILCLFMFFGCVMLDKYVLGIMGKKWNKGGAGWFKMQKAHGGGVSLWFMEEESMNPGWLGTPSDTLKRLC